MTSNLIARTPHDMKTILKDLIFYVLIVDKNNGDQGFLRQALNSVIPQAILESVTDGEEAVRYFNNCKTVPHLIFLSQDMLEHSGRNMIELIKRVDGLNKVPIIFLTNNNYTGNKNELIKLGANDLYSKPYGAIDLLNIVESVNGKWLA
jgi:CheY-like chemotaxis protein